MIKIMKFQLTKEKENELDKLNKQHQISIENATKQITELKEHKT